ncbi:hypothetical protein H6G89_19200 [Oscillatoria sp. FACHB-1407]|uniref:anthrone oxygenase family protein n=1 Tax=Oscillatoria sp. FACHB-1407 TaxID=2692847 RepID=UPI001685994D|nr:anthrone oxygenase family protein [Oscillatoria sp. FACHB-1407]MBD2463167.1 hypothetical protein [Oscillatoria sp. FACHB-1407]
MQRLATSLQVSALIALSAFSGAFLFIALVMVKFWQSLEPQRFLDWMTNDLFFLPKLMVPLNMVSLLLAIAALAVSWKPFPNQRLILSFGVFLILICTLTFPVYFADANTEFVTQSIELSQVATKLSTWSIWHWVRTGLALLAVGCFGWNAVAGEQKLSSL